MAWWIWYRLLSTEPKALDLSSSGRPRSSHGDTIMLTRYSPFHILQVKPTVYFQFSYIQGCLLQSFLFNSLILLRNEDVTKTLDWFILNGEIVLPGEVQCHLYVTWITIIHLHVVSVSNRLHKIFTFRYIFLWTWNMSFTTLSRLHFIFFEQTFMWIGMWSPHILKVDARLHIIFSSCLYIW